MSSELKVTVAITGASGAKYGLRLVESLLAEDSSVFLLVSVAGRMVINTETDLCLPDGENVAASELQDLFSEYLKPQQGKLRVFGLQDWLSPVASGTSCPKTMVVCPCSGGTLSAIANGACNNLIERGADVVLKERGKLILVSRETPYSAIHLEHMLKLARLGVTIMPASPGFYQSPKSVEDLIDFMVARVLDQMGVKHQLLKPWSE